jgi:hypothetical protein
LLPIYKAAASRYGVPWQILAAINEVETNYGADLSVSSAGAVGWMQFMPATWLSYGVDALNAGYADPYNPIDAIFAAARYLRAAGATKDLRSSLLAYNHSQEYVASVLLRAKLISSYPRDVIAALTGLASARLPLTGRHVSWGHARARPAKSMRSPQLVAVTGAPGAFAVAVQDGRIVRLGRSRALGRFVVLQDIYGDEFTYAGLGSIAASYPRSNAAAARRTGVAATQALLSADASPVGGKVRLFAHPENPDAVAIAAGTARHPGRRAASQLHPGALVLAGTELGRVNVPAGAHQGHIRFAIRPAGDPGTIDPRPVLASWALLESALHLQGAKVHDPLAGATASDALLLSRAQLERAALSDPGVTLDACSRHQIASAAGVASAGAAGERRASCARSTSWRSMASRSRTTSAPERSPTTPFARCSRFPRVAHRGRSGASCATRARRALTPRLSTGTGFESSSGRVPPAIHPCPAPRSSMRAWRDLGAPRFLSRRRRPSWARFSGSS